MTLNKVRLLVYQLTMYALYIYLRLAIFYYRQFSDAL